jgi:hypothetical protein
MGSLHLLHNLSVGDQREQGGSTYDIPHQNGYHEVSDHHADAPTSRKASMLPATIWVKPPIAVRYVINVTA